MRTILTHILTILLVITVPIWIVPFMIGCFVGWLYTGIYEAMNPPPPSSGWGFGIPPHRFKKIMEKIREDAVKAQAGVKP